ncbi:MAG: sulfotransferase [Sphingomonas fennica]
MRETGNVAEALAHAAHLVEADPALALAQASAILAAVPGHPLARLIEGQALRRTGALAEARDLLSSLAVAQPRAPAVALELGLVEAALGDETAAVATLRRAAAAKPDSAQIWSALAAVLRQAGREAEADAAALSALRAATRDPLLIEAAVAMGEGRIPQAEALLRDRLRIRPDDFAATRMLGEIAWRIGRGADAVTLLRRALQLSPGFTAARELLARVLSRMNRVPEALDEAERLLAAAPGDPEHLMLKASLLVRVGDQEGARLLYEGLLARHPAQPRTWLNLGHVCKTLGRQADGITAYRRAIALLPSLGEAWWSLANLKTVKLDAADIGAMRQALAGAATDDDRLHLHFALGKALEDAGDDRAAFAAYDVGNRLRRAALPYDADALHAETVAAAALFDAPFLSARAGGGCPAPDPIFIVGLPRSGSTLVEQILSSHSQVEGTMELPDLMMMAARLASVERDGRPVPYADIVAGLDAEDRRRLGEEYLERTRANRRTDRPFFVDKMPNNWQHVGLIQLILPNAKIIDARRHPVGCCFSAWKQHFARGQAFSYDLVDVGRYYRDYVAQMAAFDAAMPGRVHRVIYERMVADTRGEVERLLAAVGLPFEEECLAFWRNTRSVRTASSEQVRTPIFTDAVAHWRRFEPELAPLIETLGPVATLYPEVPPK